MSFPNRRCEDEKRSPRLGRKSIFALMLRAIPLLSALVLLLSSTSQATAALVSAASASLPPATSENTSTAFLNDGSESRIGLLCHNDPVNKSDPTGLLSEAENLPPEYTLQILRGINALWNGASIKAILDAQPYAGNTTGKWAIQQGFAASTANKDTNAGEAVRHEALAAELARKYTEKQARAILNAHERGETDRKDSARDQFNNELGIQNAPNSKSRNDSAALARKDWQNGTSARDKNDPRIPGPDEKKTK